MSEIHSLFFVPAVIGGVVIAWEASIYLVADKDPPVLIYLDVFAAIACGTTWVLYWNRPDDVAFVIVMVFANLIWTFTGMVVGMMATGILTGLQKLRSRRW